MEIISFTIILVSVSTGLIAGVLICQYLNKERDKKNYVKGYSDATDKAIKLTKEMFKKDE